MKIKTTKLNRVNSTVQLIGGVTVTFNSNLEAELLEEDRFEEICERDKSIFDPNATPTEDSEPTSGKTTVNPTEPVKEQKEEGDEIEVPEGMEKRVVTQEDIDINGPEIGKVGDVILFPIEEEEEDEINLTEMTVVELQETCKELEIPAEEWKDLKKQQLIDFLNSKIEQED